MLRIALVILLVLACNANAADAAHSIQLDAGIQSYRTWMNRENPNELGLWIEVNSCPFTYQELQSLAEGEFLRARVKPTSDTSFYIWGSVTCLEIRNGGRHTGWAMKTDLRFGTEAAGYLVLYNTPSYGSLYSGGTDADTISYFRNEFKESVEEALTVYLRANFSE